jgi:hypothetical protein
MSAFDSWRDRHSVHVLEMPFCSFDVLNIMAQGFIIGLNSFWLSIALPNFKMQKFFI